MRNYEGGCNKLKGLGAVQLGNGSVKGAVELTHVPTLGPTAPPDKGALGQHENVEQGTVAQVRVSAPAI